MKRKSSKKALKKRLRAREKELQKYLCLFLERFNPELSFDDPNNFRPLLKLRWFINDFLYLRLKIHPAWASKQWFLELFDVDDIKIKGSNVELTGDIVWWAEGKDAVGEWWPDDHEPHRLAPYKIKIRGDIRSGGYWILEPLTARLKKSALPKHNARYEIEFGHGHTFMKIKSKR